MFLYSLFTDTTNPAVCSVQLQDGLTALSNTVIITLHALEESEDAAFLRITSNYSLMNEAETYNTEQIRHTEAALDEGIVLSIDPVCWWLSMSEIK